MPTFVGEVKGKRRKERFQFTPNVDKVHSETDTPLVCRIVRIVPSDDGEKQFKRLCRQFREATGVFSNLEAGWPLYVRPTEEPGTYVVWIAEADVSAYCAHVGTTVQGAYPVALDSQPEPEGEQERARFRRDRTKDRKERMRFDAESGMREFLQALLTWRTMPEERPEEKAERIAECRERTDSPIPLLIEAYERLDVGAPGLGQRPETAQTGYVRRVPPAPKDVPIRKREEREPKRRENAEQAAKDTRERHLSQRAQAEAQLAALSIASNGHVEAALAERIRIHADSLVKEANLPRSHGVVAEVTERVRQFFGEHSRMPSLAELIA